MKKSKIPKATRFRLRRNSYFKKVVEHAKPWYHAQNPDIKVEFGTTFYVNLYLKEVYSMVQTSTSMRAIKGEKINRAGSWKVRIDYITVHDPKQFLMFNLKFAPQIIDNTWFYKNNEFPEV